MTTMAMVRNDERRMMNDEWTPAARRRSPTGAHLDTAPKSVGKRSAAGCGAPAAAIGASGTLRSFHHGLAFGGAAAGPSDTAALRGGAEDAPEHLRDGQNVLTKRFG